MYTIPLTKIIYFALWSDTNLGKKAKALLQLTGLGCALSQEEYHGDRDLNQLVTFHLASKAERNTCIHNHSAAGLGSTLSYNQPCCFRINTYRFWASVRTMPNQAVETCGEEISGMGMKTWKLKGEVGVLVFIMGNKMTHDLMECKKNR